MKNVKKQAEDVVDLLSLFPASVYGDVFEAREIQFGNAAYKNGQAVGGWTSGRLIGLTTAEDVLNLDFAPDNVVQHEIGHGSKTPQLDRRGSMSSLPSLALGRLTNRETHPSTYSLSGGDDEYHAEIAAELFGDGMPNPNEGYKFSSAVSKDELVELNTKLTKASKSASAARKKLAIRRVIREIEALIKKHPTAPNRFEALDVLFRSQQVLVSLDKSATNRKAFLATCEKLAAAPNEYAALRLDADLIITQAKSARQGADSHARSDALRPLVERYRDTEVEPMVIESP